MCAHVPSDSLDVFPLCEGKPKYLVCSKADELKLANLEWGFELQAWNLCLCVLASLCRRRAASIEMLKKLLCRRWLVSVGAHLLHSLCQCRVVFRQCSYRKCFEIVEVLPKTNGVVVELKDPTCFSEHSGC